MPAANNILVGLIFFLLVFLVAYSFGKRMGKKQGIRIGRTETHLLLRAQSLRENRCPICSRSPHEPM